MCQKLTGNTIMTFDIIHYDLQYGNMNIRFYTRYESGLLNIINVFIEYIFVPDCSEHNVHICCNNSVSRDKCNSLVPGVSKDD